MEIEPDRQTFPMRNRIISGWSNGLLVVEAGVNSGALISVTQALEQGRNVYAVPGHINTPTAFGSNRLIQQGAKLVMDANDILDDLQILLPETKPAPEAATRALPALSDEETRVYESIRETETSIDDIATKAELPSGTVSSTLLRLELKKLVNGSSTTFASKSFTVSPNTWYTVRLEVIGSALSLYVNGTLQLTANDSQFAAGRAGLATFFASAVFDDVVVNP